MVVEHSIKPCRACDVTLRDLGVCALVESKGMFVFKISCFHFIHKGSTFNCKNQDTIKPEFNCF